MRVNGHRQNLFGGFLPDHIFVQLLDDLAWRWHLGEQLLTCASPPPFLLEDRLAQLDALATDVNVPRSLDQWPHVAIAFAAERTERVLFRGASTTAASSQVPT
jgi:hypothetical protein